MVTCIFAKAVRVESIAPAISHIEVVERKYESSMVSWAPRVRLIKYPDL